VGQRKTANYDIGYDFYVADPRALAEKWHIENVEHATFVMVSWEESRDFVAAMLGEYWNEGGVLRRNLPEEHPYEGGLRCTSLTLSRLLGKPNESDEVEGAPAWEKVEYLAQYQSQPFKYREDGDKDTGLGELARYTEVVIEPEIEAYPVGQAFKYNDTDFPGVTGQIPEPPAQLMYKANITLRLHYWPAVNWPKIQSCSGKVNSATVKLPGGFDMVAETALLKGVRPIRIPMSPTGVELYRLDVSIGYRPKGWNKIWHNPSADFVGVTSITGSAKPYVTADITEAWSMPTT
jgi:hypothetical protein